LSRLIPTREVAEIREPTSNGELWCFEAMHVGLTNPPQFAQPLRYFGFWERALLAIMVIWCATLAIGRGGPPLPRAAAG